MRPSGASGPAPSPSGPGVDRRAHENARRNQSIRCSVAADASTCDSVPSYPVRPRRRRCKHLRRRGRSVHGPFGQDLLYGPGRQAGYGVIHELGARTDHSSSVVHGPSTRPGTGDPGTTTDGGRAQRSSGQIVRPDEGTPLLPDAHLAGLGQGEVRARAVLGSIGRPFHPAPCTRRDRSSLGVAEHPYEP